MNTVTSIFLSRPEAWAYRGDSFLWDALGWELSNRVARSDDKTQVAANIDQILIDTFSSIVVDGKRQGDGIALPWLPKDGMSCGALHMQTWNDKLLPELSRRLRKSTSLENGEMEYHPAEHRFRFAAWAAATAARSSRRVCTFPVSAGAELLRKSELRWLALGPHWLPRTREEFDRAHSRWCEEILRLGKDRISEAFTYGISAKLVNCYLKALFLQTMAGPPFDPFGNSHQPDLDVSTTFLHPPIDRLLMVEAAKRADSSVKKSWKKLVKIGWSNFSHDEYIQAMSLIREMVGEDVAQIEACWMGYQ